MKLLLNNKEIANFLISLINLEEKIAEKTFGKTKESTSVRSEDDIRGYF